MLRKFKAYAAYAALGATIGAIGAAYAPITLAQVPAPTSQGIVAGLGSNTSGSETGIYEVVAGIKTVWTALIAVVVLVIAYRLIIRASRKISRAL